MPSAQQQSHVIWDARIYNLADYPTKHHSAQHRKLVRHIYLYEEGRSPTHLQGCEESLAGSR